MACPCCVTPCVLDTCVCKTLDEYTVPYSASQLSTVLLCERDAAGRTLSPSAALLTLSGYGVQPSQSACPGGATPYDFRLPTSNGSNSPLNGSYLLQANTSTYDNGKAGPLCDPGLQFSGVFSIPDDRFPNAQWRLVCQPFASGLFQNAYAAIIDTPGSGQGILLTTFAGGLFNKDAFIPVVSMSLCGGASISAPGRACDPRSALLEPIALP